MKTPEHMGRMAKLAEQHQTAQDTAIARSAAYRATFHEWCRCYVVCGPDSPGEREARENFREAASAHEEAQATLRAVAALLFNELPGKVTVMA